MVIQEPGDAEGPTSKACRCPQVAGPLPVDAKRTEDRLPGVAQVASDWTMKLAFVTHLLSRSHHLPTVAQRHVGAPRIPIHVAASRASAVARDGAQGQSFLDPGKVRLALPHPDA